MDARVATIIQTDDSEAQNVHFEWNQSKTVNVILSIFSPEVEDWIESQQVIDTFGFSELPTLNQVVIACEAYFSS